MKGHQIDNIEEVKKKTWKDLSPISKHNNEFFLLTLTSVFLHWNHIMYMVSTSH